MLVLLLYAALGAQAAGKITAVSAPAAIQSKEASKGMSFSENESLKTGEKGHLRAQLNDGSTLSLGNMSAVRIVRVDDRTEQAIIELSYGQVRVNVTARHLPDSYVLILTNLGTIDIRSSADVLVDSSSPIETTVMVSGAAEKVTAKSTDPNHPVPMQLTPGRWRISMDSQPIRMIDPN